ncbi:putative holin-like toxin [Paenibacillus sp.]
MFIIALLTYISNNNKKK